MPEIAHEYILCYKDTCEKENRSSAHIYFMLLQKKKRSSIGGSSGLMVKVLTCNRKVAGSSLTRVRLFLTYEFTQLYLQRWGGVYHCILWRGCKVVGPGELVNISNLCYSSLLVKPYLVKTLVDKNKKTQKTTWLQIDFGFW